MDRRSVLVSKSIVKKPFLGDFDPSKDKVFEEKKGGIFVFGSNLSGAHGGGAAATAVKKYGAVSGKGEGLQGLTYRRVACEPEFPGAPNYYFQRTGGRGVNNTAAYALPTKGFDIETLPLQVIDYFIGRLNACCINNPELSFFVTRVGCGLGGYKDEEMSGLFDAYHWSTNVILPSGWSI